jgi:hypothetical protein
MDNELIRKRIQNLFLTPEEVEGYGGDESIMDEYIKQNDPEQWEKIQSARGTQQAIQMGLGGGGGFAGIAKRVPTSGMMKGFAPIRKDITEAQSKLTKDIYNKATGHLNPETASFGKVSAKDLSQSGIGKVTQEELAQQGLGKVIQKSGPEQGLGKVTQTGSAEQAAGTVKNIAEDRPLTLMEQLKKIEHTLDTDPRFLRLNELLKEKKAQMGKK